jgi:solute carrier family 25 uncoupling protein 8/9
MSKDHTRAKNILKHMGCAGFSGCLTECIVIPFDTTKARLMMDETFNGSFPKHLKKIVGKLQKEGLRAFFKGLTPGLHRQIVFASTRIGLYDPVTFLYDLLDSSICL